MSESPPTIQSAPRPDAPTTPRAAGEAQRTDVFVVGLTLLFLALNSWAVFHHVLWRDEWSVFQLAASSPQTIFKDLTYGGRPCGWIMIAWALNQLHLGTAPLKILHVLISTAGIFLFARFSPFSRVQKALFAFGYYPLYEFGNILRDYALQMLLITIACILLTRPRRRTLAFGIVLALLTQTTMFGILFGFLLGCVYLADLWRARTIDKDRPRIGVMLLAGGLAAIGAFLSYLEIRPAADVTDPHSLARLQPLDICLRNTVAYFWRGYVPVPLHGIWDTNFLDFYRWIQFGLGGAMFLTFVILLWPRRVAFWFFLVTSLILAAFFTRMPHTGMRHHGHYFVALVIACWFYFSSRQARQDRALGIADQPRRATALSACFSGLLLVNFFCGPMALVDEWQTPISGSLEAAQTIEQVAPKLPIIADQDFAAGPVSGYLDRPIYIACRQEYSTFTWADSKRLLFPMPPDKLSQVVDQFMQKNKSDVILLLNYEPSLIGPGIVTIAHIDHAQRSDESYWILLCIYHPPGTRPSATGH